MNADRLSHLPEPMREAIGKLVDRIRALAGKQVLEVCLYGRVASAQFDAESDSVLSVLVLQQFDLRMLRELASEGVAFGKRRLTAPIVMTPGFIEESLDTFPLELLEIQQQHATIVGDDHFSTLTFQPSHIRHQCERELKTLLIGMRQGLLAAAARERLLERVKQGAVEMLLRTLRGYLWLKGQTDHQPDLAVVDAVEQVMSRKLPGIRQVMEDAAHDTWQQFLKLYDDIDALRKEIDAC